MLPDMEKLYGKEVEKNAAKYAGKSQKFVEENMGEIYMLWEHLPRIYGNSMVKHRDKI